MADNKGSVNSFLTYKLSSIRYKRTESKHLKAKLRNTTALSLRRNAIKISVVFQCNTSTCSRPANPKKLAWFHFLITLRTRTSALDDRRAHLYAPVQQFQFRSELQLIGWPDKFATVTGFLAPKNEQKPKLTCLVVQQLLCIKAHTNLSFQEIINMFYPGYAVYEFEHWWNIAHGGQGPEVQLHALRALGSGRYGLHLRARAAAQLAAKRRAISWGNMLRGGFVDKDGAIGNGQK